MGIRTVLSFILCGALVIGVQASPISYYQIQDSQPGGRTRGNSGQQNPSLKSEQPNASLTIESPEHPEFVRLSDGRVIPYGAGVICSDICVEGDAVTTPPGLSKRWLIALPIIAGAVITGILVTQDPRPVPRPTNVGSISQPPTTSPTPITTPTPGNPPGNQPEPVPEPSTLALLGAGLAFLSRRRVIKAFKQEK